MKGSYSLVVSEKFRSIQGEGQTVGRRALFIRLAGCNLLCKSDKWVCDSIEVWKTGTRIPFEDVLTLSDIDYLKDGAHLIITGGEPMLHQASITAFLHYFLDELKFLPTIEIETNGTIIPSDQMVGLVNYWNVSPKLQNSGAAQVRYNRKALEVYNSLNGTIFKFVVYSRFDIGEIITAFVPFIDRSKIWLMPAADNKPALDEVTLTVVELCKEFGYNFSTRLQVQIWNKTTGV